MVSPEWPAVKRLGHHFGSHRVVTRHDNSGRSTLGHLSGKTRSGQRAQLAVKFGRKHLFQDLIHGQQCAVFHALAGTANHSPPFNKGCCCGHDRPNGLTGHSSHHHFGPLQNSRHIA